MILYAKTSGCFWAGCHTGRAGESCMTKGDHMENKKKTKSSLFKNLGFWILVATVLGAGTGLLLGPSAHALAPVGELFMQLIKMVVVPMVFVSLVGGAAALGRSKGAGKIGFFTFLYYGVTTLISVILGIVVSELFQPGAGINMASISEAAVDMGDLSGKADMPGFWETLIGFVPANPFAALVEGNILQVITFSLFFGFGLAALPKEKKEFMLKIFDSSTEVCIKIIMAIMYIAPLGVFCLMADATGSFGYSVLLRIIQLVGLYVVVLVIITYIMVGGSISLFSRTVGYGQFFRAMWKVQILAFSTASSMAALPLNMETAVRELKISKETTSFALPLGATINMNGNAAYYAMAACFLAQMYGMELTMAQFIAIVVTSTIGAVGQAGVPGPTLLVVAVLVAAGIPLEALPILFGVDRIFDMLRTAVNITGDAACAAIVDRFRRE